MGEQTAISWCDHTFNSWWGCWKIADECKNCYADSLAKVYAPGHWGRTEPRRFFGDKHWAQLAKWNRKAIKDGIRRRVFVGSMMDWAEVHPDAEIAAQMHAARRRLWVAIRECTGLDFLLLTKRPEDAARLLPWQVPHLYGFDDSISEPWANCWIGVTAGTRESARTKIQALRRIPAAVRFVSCEPLLEEISATDWRDALAPTSDEGPIHWLIVGNESGPRRRPAEMDWVRVARDEAARYGVAFHFKQWVEKEKVHLPILDGKQWAEFPKDTPHAD